jgi:hypothetical protein
MKSVLRIRLILFIISFAGLSLKAVAQVRNVIVETYYVADNNDLTDTLNGRRLQVGSKTYRVYVEVEPGSKVKKIFGDSLHPLVFRSDSVFYNNTDRPNAEFGYELQLSWMEDAPLLALDSWISLGYAARNQKGVLKDKDSDGGQIAGTNNLGGTAGIAGGLLVNNDPAAGLPLTQADGYQAESVLPGSWIDVGFKDAFGNDTTVFGPDSSGNEFYCVGCALVQTAALKGASTDSNRVLVAQLTTAGGLSFELNIELEQVDQNGNPINISYVASDDSLRPGEVVSPYLTYPLQCGCNDPDYLEYSQIYTCLEEDSCKTLIVFGCMDSMACNYNPDANFSLPNLCCYPGKCNDLDISLVCPQLNEGRFGKSELIVYPNPGSGLITLEVYSNSEESASLDVMNLTGQKVYSKSVYLDSGITRSEHNLDFLPAGIYSVRFISESREKNTRLLIVK